jgi:hypothetical protein
MELYLTERFHPKFLQIMWELKNFTVVLDISLHLPGMIQNCLHLDRIMYANNPIHLVLSTWRRDSIKQKYSRGLLRSKI